MTVWARVGLLGMVSCGFVAGCRSDADEPDLFGGAGLTIELPAGSDTLAWIRVGLWDENASLPPGCTVPQSVLEASSSRAWFFPETAELDSCTLKQVTIRNYTGDRVRYIESMPYDNTLGYPWDAKDDLGNPVPSGYYPIFSRCLDSRNAFTFRGHYFVWEVGEVGVCEWPLWLQRLEPPPASRVLQFYRFPLFAETYLLDDEGIPVSTVPFLNPFLVRVEAPGMIPFETEVTLAADRWSPVRVTWTPATLFGATAATGSGPMEPGMEAR